MDKPFENGCGHRKKVTIIFAILFVLTVIFVNSCKTPENNVSCARQTSAYAVIDLRSGKIIKSSNGQAKLPIASTTKILSAITVIEEVFDLDEEIFVPSAAVGIEGSSVYLSPGERISYRDLLYGLMLRSGNDCAVALAIKTSGSVEKFVAKMNEVAKKAGAINSSFANPHGLDDEKHYSTADDLAKITAYAMKNDVFRTIVSTKYHDTSGEVSRCFKNKKQNAVELRRRNRRENRIYEKIRKMSGERGGKRREKFCRRRPERKRYVECVRKSFERSVFGAIIVCRILI